MLKSDRYSDLSFFVYRFTYENRATLSAKQNIITTKERVHAAYEILITYKRLLDRPNVNEVILRGKKLTLKFCQSIELLIYV